MFDTTQHLRYHRIRRVLTAVPIVLALMAGSAFTATAAHAAAGDYTAISGTSDGKGYALVAGNGHVATFGTVVARGNPTGFSGTITGISVTGDGKGYVAVSSAGQVYAFGTAVYRANPTGFSGSIVGISLTDDGRGYAAISSAGQVYAYGTVVYRANPTGFSGSIVGISVTSDGRGYVAISSVGQVYAYGTALYHANPTGFSGSITGIAVTGDGRGYAAISSVGQVYAYGVVYRGNPSGFTGSIADISVTGDGRGYGAVSTAGQVYAYGTFAYNGNGVPQATPQDHAVDFATRIMAGNAMPSVAGSTPWPGGRVPYSYGGGHGVIGPSYGTCNGYTGSVPCGSGQFGDPLSTKGVDCSGFAHWVYSLTKNANVLDGGSDAQMTMMGGVRTTAPVAGDLVFWVGQHVGVYIGNDTMINANHTGSYIEKDGVSSHGGTAVFVHYAQL